MNCRFLPSLALAACLALIPAPLAAQASKAAESRKPRHGWWARVEKAHAAQPHWITPVATVTPLLAEEIRFDASREIEPNGSVTASFFNGKGLELIPTERIEVIAGIPAYVDPGAAGARAGWGDFPMLMKYRMFSAPAGEGNYVLTAFFGATFPTGTDGHGSGETILKPAIAFGKGWGNFDVQGTFGGSLPTGSWQRLGSPVALNVAFQYHTLQKLWPELEVNSTSWFNGASDGKKETFLTPGIVLGRFPFHGRIGLVFGAGVQIATTHFHRSNHNWIFTVRFPF